MPNSLLHFLLSVLTLVIGGALEELFPKVAGVGFPVLLAAVQFSAVRRPVLVAALFALAAGAVEDSLSSLPVMTSASYFLSVAFLTHWLEFPRAAILLTYPCYQLWLWMWMPMLRGNVFHRVLVSVPIGLLAVVTVGAVLVWVERRAAIDEAG